MKKYNYLINKVKVKSGLFLSMLMLALGSCSFNASAGVALGATRVIYPAGEKQAQLTVNNNDANSTFLIQSWIENDKNAKDQRFIITPPLFSMKGKKENILRIVDNSGEQLPKDRESLFWINVKAIPSLEISKMSENTLQFAIVSRIKLYYRPQNLSMSPDQAAYKLKFSRSGGSLLINNPTPYYVTMTEVKAGTQTLDNALVPPMGSISVKLPANAGNDITYKTINDYGAVTSQMKGTL